MALNYFYTFQSNRNEFACQMKRNSKKKINNIKSKTCAIKLNQNSSEEGLIFLWRATIYKRELKEGHMLFFSFSILAGFRLQACVYRSVSFQSK